MPLTEFFVGKTVNNCSEVWQRVDLSQLGLTDWLADIEMRKSWNENHQCIDS